MIILLMVGAMVFKASHISDDGKVTVIALENYTRRAVDLKPMANQLYKLAKD